MKISPLKKKQPTNHSFKTLSQATSSKKKIVSTKDAKQSLPQNHKFRDNKVILEMSSDEEEGQYFIGDSRNSNGLNFTLNKAEGNNKTVADQRPSLPMSGFDSLPYKPHRKNSSPFKDN